MADFFICFSQVPILIVNSYHLTIKFTAEISNVETTFLDTVVYKGNLSHDHSILHIETHFKPTETFQYRHFFFREEPGGYGAEGKLKDFKRPYHGFRRHFDE